MPANFGWLGLKAQTALDPCESIRAAAVYLRHLSRYESGNPVTGIADGYAMKVVAAGSVKAAVVDPVVAPECDARPADVWAVQSCRDQQKERRVKSE
jgi:hypothetical protein